MRQQAHSTLFLELETLACDPIIQIQLKKPVATLPTCWSPDLILLIICIEKDVNIINFQ